MHWTDHFLPIAKWALHSQDLRHPYLHCATPDELDTTAGIAWCLENVAVLSIYEAALGKGYRNGHSIAYEVSYPGDYNTNPPRADLGFKEAGQGKNWAYVEVKYYGWNGKQSIRNDIEKLRRIEKRAQRWIFTYRVRPIDGASKELKELMESNFSSDLADITCDTFQTVTPDGDPGQCDVFLARVV